MNIIENEDLAWECFGKAVSDKDIVVCYDMSLKDFEHSGVHDLFKVCILFFLVLITLHFSCLTVNLSLIFVGNVEVHCSIQAGYRTGQDEDFTGDKDPRSERWMQKVGWGEDEAKELQNHIEELKTDVTEKDTRLDHLQKRNDELSALLTKAKEDAVTEFRASKQFTDFLDTNYAASFEDFRMDAMENFLEVDFSSIKLNLAAATSSLIQTNFEDVNIEDDATTQPSQDVENDPPQWTLVLVAICVYLSLSLSLL